MLSREVFINIFSMVKGCKFNDVFMKIYSNTVITISYSVKTGVAF